MQRLQRAIAQRFVKQRFRQHQRLFERPGAGSTSRLSVDNDSGDGKSRRCCCQNSPPRRAGDVCHC
ncbi:hypothetical protein ACF0H2_07700 [Serratia marcescens]